MEALGDPALPAAVGEEPVVADADEPAGEHVEEEAAGELVEGELEVPGATAAVVLVTEPDVVLVEFDESVVGDGDAVSVAGEVGEHGVGPVTGD
jgi:hypothetical protein